MYAGKTVSLIMAAADNGVIGNEGGLPWTDFEDLRWFKHQTMGKTVVFGSKTFENLPKLEGRNIVVLTRTGLFKNPLGQKIQVANSIQEAVAYAPTKDVFIGGGRECYLAAEPFVDRWLISHIKDAPQGDTYSPFYLPWYKENAKAAKA